MITVNGVSFDNDAVKGDAWEDITPAIFESLGLKVKAEKRNGKARAGAGRRDLKVFKRDGGIISVDAKSGASVLSYDNTKRHLIQGSSVVCYAPIIPDEACTINADKKGVTIDFNRVEYYIVTKEAFINAVIASGLYKENFISSAGDAQIHMRTFYSNTQKKIMSVKKYNTLVNMLFESDITTELEAL